MDGPVLRRFMPAILAAVTLDRRSATLYVLKLHETFIRRAGILSASVAVALSCLKAHLVDGLGLEIQLGDESSNVKLRSVADWPP